MRGDRNEGLGRLTLAAHETIWQLREGTEQCLRVRHGDRATLAGQARGPSRATCGSSSRGDRSAGGACAVGKQRAEAAEGTEQCFCGSVPGPLCCCFRHASCSASFDLESRGTVFVRYLLGSEEALALLRMPQ